MLLSICCLIWKTLAILGKLLGTSFLNDQMELLIKNANHIGSGKIGHYQNNYKWFI